MQHHFNTGLLILSSLVSFLSSYTAFRLFQLSAQRAGTARHWWVAASAVAIGGGAIWAMHFIAMLAVQFDGMTIGYDMERTVLSLFVAVGATAIGLSAVSMLGVRTWVILGGGSVMGIGVASMHYLGMSAINIDAVLTYDIGLVLLSVGIAVVASIAALWLVAKLNRDRARLAGAAVMATAVTSMHHVGMAAVDIRMTGSSAGVDGLRPTNMLSPDNVAYGVAAVTLFVLTVGIIAAFQDHRAYLRRKAAAGSLAAAEHLQERWRKMLDDVPQIIWSTDADGSGVYQNQRWFDFTGSSRANAQEWIELIHPDDRPCVLSEWQACRARRHAYHGQFRLQHFSGGYRWVSTKGEPKLDEHGEVSGWIGTCTDIDARVEAETDLLASQALTKGIIEASPDCIGVLDVAGTVLFMNDAFRLNAIMSGGSYGLGSVWGAGFPSDLHKAAKLAVETALSGHTNSMTLAFDSPEQGLRWWDTAISPIQNDAGDVFRLAVIARDITRQKLREAEARWTASHDALTNLPSRILFHETLANALADGEPFCILILDVDNFKRINDMLGHQSGDALLIELANRLVSSIGSHDFAARIGGDEFVVILRNLTSDTDARNRADRIADHLKQPWLHSGRLFDCAASVGASLFPDHGDVQPLLMKNADIALYVAKTSGRGEVVLYDPPMRLATERRTTMLARARAALDDDLIFPCYQAMVDLRTRRLVGFEALLRLRHRTRGVQLPGTIEAAFEDAELAARISERMITCVLADIRRWLDKRIEFGHVTINAAAAEFRRGDFAEQLLSKLAAADISTAYVQIEVTETVFLGRGAEYVEQALKLLSAHGVKIGLDDFGTGYASLSHLRQFPVDVIKIDRSFVQGLPADAGGVAIVDAVISLGRSLNIAVVAEGIETLDQEKLLAGLGCPFGQGFLYGKALPASRVPNFARAFSRKERLAA
ncbi:bifunctional diguanylate cyclase/phosphodiesterase [Sphingomonas qomolangmaensis]|uniref:EAL domain-containing protein n=1 Tax=Sphingomonas qomolangmaensis TaxID=2918765 RepID=A0ABY5L9Q3_9SPHN|nr:EAL domain-containing protein [Sphingomonas qomolangmaensis]UUL83167.1 EAL domain-containing protein [Sphingomonas qomolangmaensis]